MPFEKDPSEIGAIWMKTGSKGDWLSGTINGEPFVAFPNTKKAAGSKAPDYIVKRPMKKEPVAAVSREPGSDDLADF
jgi:hypothetical protein